MPAYSPTQTTAAASLPFSITRWIRATYQAPFQNAASSLSVRDLDRFRRAALLRIITFNLTLVASVWMLVTVLLFQAGNAGTLALGILILAGLLSLGCNARGWVTFAGGLYMYGFLLAIYLYIILAPPELDILAIALYGTVNAILFLGGLAFSQRVVWPNGGLVILVSSLLLFLSTLYQKPAPGATTTLPTLMLLIDGSYLLTTFLCWLAGRSGRVSMIKLATILEQEQQLVALKDLFIISANHELRTPIMTLSNNLELVSRTLDRVSPEERQEMLERALRASQDLKGMLSNVLDVGVTEAEVKKHLHLEALSVRTVVQQALDTFDPREIGEPWLELTKLKSRPPISVYIPPDLVIHADGGRTRQVLVNLLSNALKYSDASAPIAISAQVLEATGEQVPGKPLIPTGSWVQINVRDWGLGVPPREQPLLFMRFVRLSRDAASSTRGTGVGLYLCRMLIQAMGGQIWVESTGVPGEGSVFSFVLPAAQDDTA